MPKQNTNALKHGAFSGQMILPGEAIEDLDELHESNMKEWRPVGAIELDCVATLTKSLWRKRRISSYQQLKLKRFKSSLLLEEERGLTMSHLLLLANFSRSLQEGDRSEPLSEYNLDDDLIPDCAKYIRDVVPRKNYVDDSAWRWAIVEEIERINVRAREFMRVDVNAFKVRLMRVEEVFNEDHMAKELLLEERIDAIMDKCIKRLIQTKALKEIIDAKASTAGIQYGETKQIGPVNGNQ